MAYLEDIEIAQATTTQAAAIVALFRRMMVDVFSESFPTEAIDHYCRDFDEQGVQEDIVNNSKIVLVAQHDKRIIGLAVGSKPNGGVASVVWLMVDPAHQGRGLGRTMMEQIFSEYRNLGAHKCVVYTETKAGRDFYTKIGMSQEGEHPNHWWGCRHYCLTKRLH